MPNIPGLRIGQGIPGGVSGLPGGGGGLPPMGLPPATTRGLPRLQLPTSSAALLPTNPSQLDRTAEFRLRQARTILRRVQLGSIEPTRAASELDRLLVSPEERQSLTREVLQTTESGGRTHDVRPQLQALRFQSAGKDPGHQTHSYEGAGGGIGSNLFRQGFEAVTGLPAGAAIVAKSAAQDVGAVARGQAPTHTFENVLKPIGEQYAWQYGPLAHGDVGEFSHRLSQAPLGPILDVAAAASFGIGAAGRAGNVASALRAASVTRDPAGVAIIGGRFKVYQRSNGLFDVRERGQIVGMNMPDEKTAIAHAQSVATGGIAPRVQRKIARDTLPPQEKIHTFTIGEGVGAPKTITAKEKGKGIFAVGDIKPEIISDDPWEDSVIGVVNYKTGEAVWGGPEVDGHYKLWDIVKQVHPGNDEDFVSVRVNRDPDTGKPAAILPTLEGEGWDRFGYKFEDGEFHRPKEFEDQVQRVGMQSLEKAMAPSPKPIRPGFEETAPISKATLARKAVTRGGPQGGLLSTWERRTGVNHTEEEMMIAKSVADVLDDPNLRINRRTFKQVLEDVRADVVATREFGRNKPISMAASSKGFISPRSTGRVLGAGGTILREASDLVRAGAIYLRPAYLPNNWAGNEFLNLVHQGVYAPVNLAKSFALDKTIGPRYTRAMDQAMGRNAATTVVAPPGRGYTAAMTDPVAHIMGDIADVPFRRAAFLHEARRAGYRKLSDIRELFNRAASNASKDRDAALADIGTISRKAQEEIIKFGHMNKTEAGVLRNLIFIYSWMRGALRYAGRFPLEHPIQAAIDTHVGEVGTDWLKEEMGGVPSFLIGAIPVGRNDNGDPILINPFALNPLGTGVDIARAIAGTARVIRDPSTFNRFAQQDIVGLLNPLAQNYINAREGGQPPVGELERSFAPLRLAKQLQHPGSGSIFPTTRQEAIGNYTFGSLFPRQADQQAITRALEREQRGDAAAMIPEQVKEFKKAFGESVPAEFVRAYRNDLAALEELKHFQKSYAKKHGSSGFRNMPPKNQVDAALEYLRDHHTLPKDDYESLSSISEHLTTDEEFHDFALGLWSMSGVGTYKNAWDDMMGSVRGQRETRMRP